MAHAAIRLAPLLAIGAGCFFDTSRPVYTPPIEEPGCPLIFPSAQPVLLDASCGGHACTGTIAQDRCRLSIEPQCEIGALRAAIGPSGELSFEPSEALGVCATSRTSSQAWRTLRCERDAAECRVDAYLPPFEPLLRAETLTLRSITAQPHVAHLASSIAVLDGGAVLVVSHDPRPTRSPCDRGAPWRFHWIDGDALAEVRTATAPPCVGPLAAEPSGGGFFAMFPEPPGLVLARFDAEGRRREEVLLSGDPAVAPRALIATRGKLYATFGRGAADDARSTLVALGVAALEERFRVAVEGELVDLAPLDAGRRIVAADAAKRTLRFHDAETGAGGFELRVGFVRGLLQTEPAWILSHPTAGGLLVGTTAKALGVEIVEERSLTGPGAPGPERAAAFHEAAAETYAGAWVHPERAVVGFSSREDASQLGDAWAAELLVGEARFRPGASRIGSGPLLAMAADRRGRVWALLPWTAAVVRIEPLR